MIRRLLAVVTSASLVAAAVAAPLTHLHDDDHATDHHGAQGVHAHFSGHASPPAARDQPGTSHVEADEYERTLSLQDFVGVPTATSTVPVAAVASTPAIALPEAQAHRSVPIITGHDPPVARSRPSRAPPAFLS